VVGCKKILDATMHDFNHVCPEREDNGVQALKRRGVLGKKVKEAKDKVDRELAQVMKECDMAIDRGPRHGWRTFSTRSFEQIGI
jgi:hypothetical protein